MEGHGPRKGVTSGKRFVIKSLCPGIKSRDASTEFVQLASTATVTPTLDSTDIIITNDATPTVGCRSTD